MGDWTTDAADTIDRSIAYLRERTVDPAYAISRAIVYGLLAALIAVPALLLLLVGGFRLLVIIEQGYVWAAWFTLGAIFMVGGGLTWNKSGSKP